MWLSWKKQSGKVKRTSVQNPLFLPPFHQHSSVLFQLAAFEGSTWEQYWKLRASIIIITHMQTRHNMYFPQRDVMLSLGLVKCFSIHRWKTLSKVKKFLFIRKFYLFSPLVDIIVSYSRHLYALLFLIPPEFTTVWF